jgi:hypothetical protein
MISCSNDELRKQSYIFIKFLFTLVEDRSRYCLLHQLIELCPTQNGKVFLLLCLKESINVASNNLLNERFKLSININTNDLADNGNINYIFSKKDYGDKIVFEWPGSSSPLWSYLLINHFFLNNMKEYITKSIQEVNKKYINYFNLYI